MPTTLRTCAHVRARKRYPATGFQENNGPRTWPPLHLLVSNARCTGDMENQTAPSRQPDCHAHGSSAKLASGALRGLRDWRDVGHSPAQSSVWVPLWPKNPAKLFAHMLVDSRQEPFLRSLCLPGAAGLVHLPQKRHVLAQPPRKGAVPQCRRELSRSVTGNRIASAEERSACSKMSCVSSVMAASTHTASLCEASIDNTDATLVTSRTLDRSAFRGGELGSGLLHLQPWHFVQNPRQPACFEP